MILEATPSCLPAVFFNGSSLHWEQLQRQYFTDGLGLPSKLAKYRGSQTVHVFPWYFQLSSFSKIREIMARELSYISPITTRCPVQPAASLAPLPDVCLYHYQLFCAIGWCIGCASSLYTFAEKQIDSTPIYMSVCGFVGLSIQQTVKTGLFP